LYYLRFVGVVPRAEGDTVKVSKKDLAGSE